MNAAVKLSTFQQLGEISMAGVFVFDLAVKQFQYVNGRFCALLYTTEDALQGNPLEFLDKIEAEDLRYLHTVYKSLGEKPHVDGIDFRTMGNQQLRHRSVDVYYFASEGLIAGFLKDATARKEWDEYISTYGAKKNTLLEMLAHNLSGPLKLSQKIIGTGTGYRKNPISVEDQLSFVRRVNEQCIETIHDLLKEEHFLSERVYIKSSRFDVVAKVKIVVDQFVVSHPGRVITLTGPEHLYVVSDDVRLMQIVNNLISNAVKFTPLNCSIQVVVLEMAASFQIIIKDDGIGIPEHLQPLIFQKYSGARRTGLNGEKSIGVGLSISKHLTELMKGTMDFVSAENQGTTFFVTLPR